MAKAINPLTHVQPGARANLHINQRRLDIMMYNGPRPYATFTPCGIIMYYNNTVCYIVDLFTPDSSVFVIATIQLDKIIMNEKHIQQILVIEKQARAVYEAAIKEAEMLPLQAEKYAQKLIEQARLDAENEARQMIEKAKAQDEVTSILAEAEKQVQLHDVIAARNIDRTVSYLINRVVGRE